MAFIETPNAVMAYLQWQTVSGSADWGVTLWFTSPSFGVSDQEALGDALNDWNDVNLMLAMSTQIKSFQCTVYDMRSPSGPVVSRTASGQIGGQTGTLGPLSVCAVVTFNTAARGKTAQGRNYISGFRQDDMDGNQIDGGRISTILASYQGLNAQTVPLGFTHVMVSFRELGVPRAQGLARAVTQYVVRSSRIASQDRRAPRP